jgi:hypothetical protein
VAQRLLQERERAHHVRLHELPRPVDRPVDVRLGREVQHAGGAVPGEQCAHARRVRDVGLLEVVARRRLHLAQRLQVSGVRQLVDVDDRVVGLAHELADEGRPDEAGAAGDETAGTCGNREGRSAESGQRGSS